MSRIDKIVQRAIDDVKREQAAERASEESSAARTEQPPDSPTREENR